MAAPKTWRRGGTAHKVLSLAADGPATFKDLSAAAGLTGKKARHKFWHKMAGLLDAKLLVCVAGVYHLTSAGRALLDELGGPVLTGGPTVRIFARAA